MATEEAGALLNGQRTPQPQKNIRSHRLCSLLSLFQALCQRLLELPHTVVRASKLLSSRTALASEREDTVRSTVGPAVYRG